MLIKKARRFQHSCFIETGLSDIRKMANTVLKMQFRKLEPKVVSYRNYKHFSNSIFYLLYIFYHLIVNCLNILFHKMRMVLNALNKYIPRKEKIIRGNHSLFINKEISQAITKRT